ncbi:hypothetical protein KXD93_25510 [Mucilaginibacter sp. BJC16-A38]|uniref:hypothetical protein n=1 Tax=Mucilaginibacter phenanthrenivorans TaxID=1234842 RepID=UPI002157C71F|nr:hypothetical protein [Mucilaginibacter phenanthrenivorans]MCR8561040.1 hypothetical protein [Mucilaginibacter phenanthrenivorans]
MSANNDDTPKLPNDWSHLKDPLYRAQEQVFLINKKLDDLRSQANPDSSITSQIKQLSEDKQHFKEGFKIWIETELREGYFIEQDNLRLAVNYQLSDKAYEKAKSDFQKSTKEYQYINYAERFLDGLKSNKSRFGENTKDVLKNIDLDKN